MRFAVHFYSDIVIRGESISVKERVTKVALRLTIIFIQTAVYTVKKRLANFLPPAGMSLTKLSLAKNNLNLIIPGQRKFG